MASILDRFRRARADAPVDGQSTDLPSAPRRRPLPPPSMLRRERRALLRAREERVRDLGGLVLEMYRQDRFRQDLVYELAAEVVGIEERLSQLDLLLAAATRRGRPRSAARCEGCGTPLYVGARFCPSCGRPAAPEPAQ